MHGRAYRLCKSHEAVWRKEQSSRAFIICSHVALMLAHCRLSLDDVARQSTWQHHSTAQQTPSHLAERWHQVM